MRTTFAVGIDVGGTRIAAGLVERKGRLVKEARTLTPHTDGPFAIVDAVIGLIDEVSLGTQQAEIAGIGIGLPAQIDFQKQSVEFCTNLPLTGVDVRSLVTSRIRQDVVIDNDGHCAGIGESRFGAAKGVRDFVMVTLGTGVGGALFLDGQPYRGSRGLGGEIGHIVVRIGGPPCPCGGEGHLEAYLGRPALAAAGRAAAESFRGSRIASLAGGDATAITAEHVVEAALAGDEAALEILAQAGDVLGEALVGVVNVLNPRLIVVGGGIGESAPEILSRAAEHIERHALAGRRDVKLVRAELGNDAGVLGAAALAFQEHDTREGLHR